jgi:hypothetical protein
MTGATKGVIKTKKSEGRVLRRRHIIKGPKSAWIYFCNTNRPRIIQNNPKVTFGETNHVLSHEWKVLSEEDRQKYSKLSNEDKTRFADDMGKLTKEDLLRLKQIKLSARRKRSEKGKSPLSAYMLFVCDRRHSVVAANPGMSFSDIGKTLGQQWRELPNGDKQRYIDQNAAERKEQRLVKEAVQQAETQ